ncbi:hypothetical protein CRUP_037742 [Coryphaenoides rupestris]|nr:hypothetical protein CRUP_037742 [Coryphaenoides rupestris]
MALQTITAVHILALVAVCSEVVRSDRVNFYNIKPPVQDTQFCMSVHHFHSNHGKTKFVTKKCAVHEECRQSGCRHHRETGHTECVSCCEGMICNIEVPTNHTNAVFAVRQIAFGSAPHQATRPWHTVVLTLGLCGRFLL